MSSHARGATPATLVMRMVLLTVVTTVVVIGQVWYGNRHHFFDLGIYYKAMRWWSEGKPLYEFSTPDATMGSLGFTYPPFGALVLRPIAWFSLPAVNVGFSAISVLLFAAVIWWLVRPVAERHGWPRWLTFGLAFVLGTGLETIRDAFTLGQINFLLWALVALDLLVLLPRRSRLVGIGIGLATAIKIFPGIFIVYLLVCRRWRAAAVATATAAAATLLGFLVDAHDSWIYFTEQMLGAQGMGQLRYAYNQSLMGVLARVGHTDHPAVALWLVLVLPVVLYGLWRASRAAAAGDDVAGMTLAGCVGSLVSPLTWSHHVFWFVPAVVILVDSALPPAGASGPVIRGVRDRRGMLILAAAIYLTVTFSVLSLWEFDLHAVGGVIGFILGNWFIWLMIALLPLLPIRRLPVARPAAAQVAVYTYGDSRSGSGPAGPGSGGA